LKTLPGIDYVIAVGSTPGDREVAEEVGVEYYPYENTPTKLGQKWQHGVEIALQQGADGIMFCGSDDVWQLNTVSRLWEAIDNGAVMVGSAAWYLVMLKTGDVYLQRYRTRDDSIGTGRLFSAQFIREKLNGFLLGKELLKDKSIDGYITRRIAAAGGKQIAVEGIEPALCKLNVGKGEGQITAASALLSSKNIISEEVYITFANDLLFEWSMYARTMEVE